MSQKLFPFVKMAGKKAWQYNASLYQLLVQEFLKFKRFDVTG